MFSTNPWNKKARLQLFEQMEMYVASGLPIAQVIGVLAENQKGRRNASLLKVQKAVESGQALSRVLSNEIRPPPAITGLLVCGEQSGTLAKSLKAAHELLEREDELRKKIVSSLTYPTVIGLATLGLTFGLVRGIMPQILPLLKSLHTELPLITRIVMSVSATLMSYGLYILLGVAALITVCSISYKRSSKVRRMCQSLFLKIPIVGGMIERYTLALFFQTFGALVQSGVLADVAYVRSVSSISLLPIRGLLERRTEGILRGQKFHTVCYKGMPSYVVPLVQAGEASGGLGNSLIRASELLDRELDQSLKQLTALVEPGMMIVMGGLVGSIALSIMMPIYEISKTIQHA